MAQCKVCGNDYDNAFQVVAQDRTHVFDSFECAIHRLAPPAGTAVVGSWGHGVEAGGTVYCCANCALASGVAGIRDRV